MAPTPALTTEEVSTLRKLFDKELYSKTNIEHWLDCEAQLRTPPFTANVRTFDRNGTPQHIPAKGQGGQLRFCSYHQTVQAAESQPQADPEFDGMLVRVTNAHSLVEPRDCCLYEKQEEEFKHYADKWLESPFCKRLMGYVADKARNMTEVKSVVCFGLGPLGPDEDFTGFHIMTCYLQHIAAIHIRNTIERAQGKDIGSIPVYVQDPAYCSNCKRILKYDLDVNVKESNSGFLEVDGNTFVITVAPAAPIRQIVGDLTKDAGGPAGILCQPIDDDGVEAADKIVDMSSPNMYQFALRVKHHNMHVVCRAEKVDSSDEEDDSFNAVYHNEEHDTVQGSIFKDIGLYFKKKT